MTEPKEIKKRKRKPKTDIEKKLKTMRDHSPVHVVEVELKVSTNQSWKLQSIQEHLRVIRNTVLGELYKNYQQMIRTKDYKKVSQQYHKLCERMEKEKDEKKKVLLEKEKSTLNDRFEELRQKHQVTFEFARKYGEKLQKNYFSHPDAVSTLSVCEMAWSSIEGLLFRNAEKPYFYKKTDAITIQGKQAERCIILKQNIKEDFFYVNFNGMHFPLIVKENDLFVQETLANILHYWENRTEIDQQNILRYEGKQELISSYRIRNNRIITKEIRGKRRYFLQMVLEGKPVPKRKKDGSFRHTYGKGRMAGDIGTQSVAIVSLNQVWLKNLAERSDNTLAYERNIYLLQRYVDRSMRANNPQNYDEKGRIKKGKKEWKWSKKCLKAMQKLQDLHRKASESRKYAHHEDINRLRAMGDELFIEQMKIKGLQQKAKEVTINEKTGKYNKRKRFGKSIGKRSPGYFIAKAKETFEATGGKVREVNTWTFKASQYDHMLDATNKKQLSQRWHEFSNGIKVQRDLYSAFLLYCAENDLQKPNKALCDQFFNQFLTMHDRCIQTIKEQKKLVLNSGIKVSKVKKAG